MFKKRKKQFALSSALIQQMSTSATGVAMVHHHSLNEAGSTWAAGIY